MFKLLFLFFNIVYIILAVKNISSKDSRLLIEKFYAFLKNLYYYIFFG